MERKEVLVSIICTAFNHEKFIKDAIESFVNQDVDFNYEILINDDCSTDHTAEIIRKYQMLYPDLIFPVFQKENQYSQGVKIVRDILVPLARGKYLAFCEGDDYWIDREKLQKQIDFLENHNKYGVCVHNSKFEYIDSKKSVVKYPTQECDLFLKDCVMCGGQSFHTSSLVVKKSIFIERPQSVFQVDKVGDYPNSIYYALSTDIHYMGDVMSVYRVGTEGSWTKSIQNNQAHNINTFIQIIAMLEKADEYSQFQFHSLFSKAIEKHNYSLSVAKEDYSKAISFKNYFKQEPKKNQIKMMFYAYTPFLVKLKNYIKRKRGKN